MDYLNFTDKICVVTGASSGIGYSVAKMLVDLGARVFTIDINDCNIEGTKGHFKCDLTNRDNIDEIFKDVPDKIDCFFGIAGLSGLNTDYIKTFNCNFTANKYITLKYLMQRMKEGGSITYVSSTAGKYWQKYIKEQDSAIKAKTWNETEMEIYKLSVTAPSSFAYVHSKRCLSQFAHEQAIAFAPKNVRVNNVMPGATATGMKDEFQTLAGGEEELKGANGDLGRLATPEEIAGPTVMLASDMAKFVTGIDLILDATNTSLIDLNRKKDNTNISVTKPFIIWMAKRSMKKKKVVPAQKLVTNEQVTNNESNASNEQTVSTTNNTEINTINEQVVNNETNNATGEQPINNITSTQNNTLFEQQSNNNSNITQ